MDSKNHIIFAQEEECMNIASTDWVSNIVNEIKNFDCLRIEFMQS